MSHALRIEDSADAFAIAAPPQPSVEPRAGLTVWLTGLSGAGKSTLATALYARLRALGVPTEVLDGDEVRTNLSQGLGFSRADRDTNVRRIAYVARLLSRHGVVVIAAAISPYADARNEARRTIGRFVEVFVNASVDTCITRDTKGLYGKALAGVITAFTGISDPYEAPTAPDLTIDTERESVEQGVEKLLQLIVAQGVLPTEPDYRD
ncbi:MAG: adenylyl-sulfate kinase [Gemmatimonadaceae bacterium]|nr:adenylyl-sulfate kinase [Gemmatimonadaceae bacterium]